MTSNVGTEHLKREPLGFGHAGNKEEVRMTEEIASQLRGTFRPEFLNRLDAVILFHHLDSHDLSRIAINLLTDLRYRLEEKGIGFDVEEETLDLVCREGYDPVNGARPLARAIERTAHGQAAAVEHVGVDHGSLAPQLDSSFPTRWCILLEIHFTPVC